MQTEKASPRLVRFVMSEFPVIWMIGGIALGMVITIIITNVLGRNTRENLAVLKSERDNLFREKESLQLQLKEEQQHTLKLIEESTTYKEQNANLREKLESQLAQQREAQEQLKIQFQNLANAILEENSQKFSKQTQTNLTQLLDPLKEKLSTFEKEIKTTHIESVKQSTALSEQVKLLKELGQQMNQEAKNLTQALKGDNKAQGNWGELILERVLEVSGLEKGREYDLQVSLDDGEGKKQIPDAVIYLPDKKHLVVDSKVSLLAYEAVVNAVEQEERGHHLVDHNRSMKRHIDSLGEKHYVMAKGLKTPDFVLMFIPVESCLSVSLQADGQLFEYAWRKKVVLVTPSTLLATLKTVASLWKYEKQNANAMEIADMGRKLYEQFVSFLKEMDKIERGLGSASSAYNDAMKRLKDGSQSIIRRVEKLRDMGVSPKEYINDKYLDNIGETAEVLGDTEGKNNG